MSLDGLTNGVTIKIGNRSFHSFTDFGLAIGNTDCIKAPEFETYYVHIPGRQGFLDLSEVIGGQPTYHSREIKIQFGGKDERMAWDESISRLRNLFHGKTVELVFDNDPEWYWTGRAEITDFERFRELGTFTFAVPFASPFKQSIEVQPDLSNIALSTAGKTITIPVTGMPVNPEFVISGTGTSTVTITANGITKTITAVGVYRYPDIWFSEDTNIVAKGPSTGRISIVYRQAKL